MDHPDLLDHLDPRELQETRERALARLEPTVLPVTLELQEPMVQLDQLAPPALMEAR